MSDVFISYASEDKARARALAEALEGQGVSVWWDRKIPPGKTWDDVIKKALDGAKCIVVLWSETSVQSNWVKEEASAGLHRGILVPALIDPVPPPLGFGRIEAADLAGWDGDLADPEFELFVQSVRATLGQSAPSASARPVAGTARTPMSHAPKPPRRKVLLAATLGTATIALLAVLYLVASEARSPDAGPTPAGFRIAEVILRADPFDYAGPCPVTIEFSGRVSVLGGSGQVSYKFLRSDGALGPIETLDFPSAGSRDVGTTWQLGASYSGWQAIKTFDPEERESERATFDVRCQ